MLDEGFDAPIADTLILASAGKSARKAIQSTGRVLRPYDGKVGGVIFDFDDQFHPMLKRQAAKRRAIYADLKYSQNNQTKY
jgi:superfamily II DNA or RNA helicase